MALDGLACNVKKPDIVSPAFVNLRAIELATVVAKLSSLLIAAANSDSVSKTAGDALIKSVTAVLTNAVEAI
jgi:hypothetical protein